MYQLILCLLLYVKCSTAAVVTAFGDQHANDLESVSDPPFSRAIRTSNPLYGPWLTPSAIPYRWGTVAATDQTMITNAMNAITANMGGSCIKFVPWTAGAGDFLQISSTFENGTAITGTCFSFPGRVLRQAGNGQKLGMINAVDGCLESQRSAMKYLVHALGLRNEYLRSDRTGILNVVPDSSLKPALQNLGLANAYLSTTSVVPLTSFDIKSITIPSPATKYVQTGTLYTPVTGTVGDQGALSVGDCIGLKSIYPTCLSVTCTDPYGGAVGSSVTSLAAGVSNAAGTSTNTGTITGSVIGGAINTNPTNVINTNPTQPVSPFDPTIFGGG